MTPNSHSSIQLPVIGEEQIQLLKKLSEAVAVSGDEGEVRKIVLSEIEGFADQITVDSMGSVLAVCKAKTENPLRVMIAAHMDEIGFMVVDKDEGGLFRFGVVGGVDLRQLPGKPVWVGKDHQNGVIGAKPIHLTTAEERTHAISLDVMRLDLGPAGGDKVRVGDRAAFATLFEQVGPSLMGKAFDDRLGVAGLITLVKNPPENVELLAAFTVQEEVGLRGAKVAGYTMEPDLAIALDVTPAHDLPTWNGDANERYNCRLGYGPALYAADGATISDPRLVAYAAATAEKYGLPYQFRQPGAGGTDAGAIHRTRSGVPSMSISTPGRYAHSAVMLCRVEDWQHTLQLIYAMLTDLDRSIFDQDR